MLSKKIQRGLRHALVWVLLLFDIFIPTSASKAVDPGVALTAKAYIDAPFVQASFTANLDGYESITENFDDFTPSAENPEVGTCPSSILGAGNPIDYNGTLDIPSNCVAISSPTFPYGGATTTNPTLTLNADGYPVNTAIDQSKSPLAAVNSGGPLKITLTNTAKYVGLWWSAGSYTNEISFYDEQDNLVATLNADGIYEKLTHGSKVKSLGGQEYFSNDYYGHPTDPVNAAPDEPFVYIHVIAENNFPIKTIEIKTFGNGFEFDNLTVGNEIPNIPDQLVLASLLYQNGSQTDSKTVTFDTRGGSSIPSQNFIPGELISEPVSNPSNGIAKFVGWFTEPTGGTQVAFPITGSENLIIYAMWSYAKITYHLNNGIDPPIIVEAQDSGSTLDGYSVSPYSLHQSNFWTLNEDGSGDFTIPIQGIYYKFEPNMSDFDAPYITTDPDSGAQTLHFKNDIDLYLAWSRSYKFYVYSNPDFTGYFGRIKFDYDYPMFWDTSEDLDSRGFPTTHAYTQNELDTSLIPEGMQLASYSVKADCEISPNLPDIAPGQTFRSYVDENDEILHFDQTTEISAYNCLESTGTPGYYHFSLFAKWIPIPLIHTISVSSDSNGLITPESSDSVPDGENITYTITPNIGFQIESVTVDGIEVSNILEGNESSKTYTFNTVSADHSISATFKPGNDIYNIFYDWVQNPDVLNPQNDLTSDVPDLIFNFAEDSTDATVFSDSDISGMELVYKQPESSVYGYQVIDSCGIKRANFKDGANLRSYISNISEDLNTNPCEHVGATKLYLMPIWVADESWQLASFSELSSNSGFADSKIKLLGMNLSRLNANSASRNYGYQTIYFNGFNTDWQRDWTPISDNKITNNLDGTLDVIVPAGYKKVAFHIDWCILYVNPEFGYCQPLNGLDPNSNFSKFIYSITTDETPPGGGGGSSGGGYVPPTPKKEDLTVIEIPKDETQPIIITPPTPKSPQSKLTREVTAKRNDKQTLITVAPAPAITSTSSDLKIVGLSKNQRVKVTLFDLNNGKKTQSLVNLAQANSIVRSNPASKVEIEISPTQISNTKKGAAISISGAKKKQRIRVTIK